MGTRTLLNEGLLIEATTGEIVDLDGSAVLNNAGTFDIRSNSAWYHFIGASGTLTITNTGIMTKTGGTGDFTFSNTTLNGTGTISILTGPVLVNGGPI